jgi:alpha-1,2-mannosyltransferase
VLIGLATAIKLVPAIFIPYLWLTDRRRAACVAVATFVALSAVGAMVAPADSMTFWTHRVFTPTSPAFFSNQSLEGMLQRSVQNWRLLWLIGVIVVVTYGMRRAVRAHQDGDELRAVAITGLVGVLISPISWIHHLVWIVPALAVRINATRSRTNLALTFGCAALFVARLPYLGQHLASGMVRSVVTDSYGILCAVLLVALVVSDRRRARSEQPGRPCPPFQECAMIPPDAPDPGVSEARHARRRKLRDLARHVERPLRGAPVG